MFDDIEEDLGKLKPKGNAMDFHQCPAPGCMIQIPFDRFACRSHWFLVSKENRDRLWSEWRNNPGEDSYFQARAACLRDLGVAEADIAGVNAGVV